MKVSYRLSILVELQQLSNGNNFISPLIGEAMEFLNRARLRCALFIFAGTVLFLMALYYTTPVRTKDLKNRPTDQSNLLTHSMQDPGSEQYNISVNNLHKCLDASNLTNYFRQENRLETAVANVKYYLDVLRRFIPNQFIATLPNHCWNADVKLDFSSSLVSGYVSGTKFSVDRKDIKNENPPTLNTLPLYGGTDYQRHHYVPLSCIPEVFFAGFHKCGSSFLHCVLTSHPAVSSPIRKEAHFFSNSDHFTDENKTALYFADYIINFKSLIQDLADEKSSTHFVGVDESVGMTSAWPNLFSKQKEINSCLLPSVIPEILPKAKFIIVMREPLSMLYSWFWYSCTRFKEVEPVPSREAQLKGPDIFHERIVAKIRHINSCIMMFPLEKCISGMSTTPKLFLSLMPKCGESVLERALYYIYIQKWLSVIPRERFLFLTLQELSGNFDQTVNTVWKFIGVNSFAVKSCKEFKNKQKTIDYMNDPRLAMRSDTREILKGFLRPYNQRLADLLGDRKFLWQQMYD